MTPPTSPDELAALVAGAAAELSGGGESWWNGRLQPLEARYAERGVLGHAARDRTCRMHEQQVLHPLGEMLASPGFRHHEVTLVRFKTALACLYHEMNHFVGPVVDAPDHAAKEALKDRMWLQDYDSSRCRPLDEGVRELKTERSLDSLIDKLGLEQIVPGLRDTRIQFRYPKFVPATAKLLGAVANITGLPEEAILNRANTSLASQQLGTLAGLIVDRPEVIQSTSREERAGFKEGAERIIEDGLSPLDNEYFYKQPRRQSGSVGTRLARELESRSRELDSLARYRRPAAPPASRDGPPERALMGGSPDWQAVTAARSRRLLRSLGDVPEPPTPSDSREHGIGR